MNLSNPLWQNQCTECDTILRYNFNYCPTCGTPIKKAENATIRKEKKSDDNPDRVSIRMDVMDDIISNMNDQTDLQSIFGVPVSKGFVIVADENDLRIEDAGLKELTEEETDKFLGILDEIIRSNAL